MVVFELLLLLLIVWYYFYISRSNDRDIIHQLRSMVSHMFKHDKDLLKKCGFQHPVLRYDVKVSPVTVGTYTEFIDPAKPTINIAVRDDTYLMYDMETLRRVFIHELAHVICPDSGHSHRFNMIENTLLQSAQMTGYITVNSQVDINYPCRI